MPIWPLSHQDIPGFESGGFQWNLLDSGSFLRRRWGSVQSSEEPELPDEEDLPLSLDLPLSDLSGLSSDLPLPLHDFSAVVPNVGRQWSVREFSFLRVC